MEIKGTLEAIFNTEQVTSTFKKREIVVNSGGEYPQSILIQFIKDKTEILNNYKVGDEVNVSININGRSWKSPKGEVKYFNTLVGWKIEKTGGGQVDNSSTVAPNVSNDEDDDLPF